MQQSNTDSFQEVGIDYITATSRNPSPVTSFSSFGAHLVAEAIRGGAPRRSSRANGYSCSHAGSVSFGRRHDGCIIRLSGSAAAESWWQVVDLADNVSRLDLQATVRVSEGPTVRLRGLWACREHKPTSRGRQRVIKAVVGRKGIETLMLGSRSSEVFGRVYDKATESGEEEYAGCLRYELELKADVAKSYALQLAESPHPERRIVATLYKFVSDCLGQRAPGSDGFEAWLKCRDLSPIVSESAYDCLSRPESRPLNRTASKSLKFIATCVSPTVRRLVDAGYEKEVLHALGLSDYEKSAMTRNNVLDFEQIGGWAN